MNALGYTELSVLEILFLFVFHRIKYLKYRAIHVTE